MLDLEKKSESILEVEAGLRGRVVGQDRAIDHLVRVLEYVQSGFASPRRPYANLLILGPTGSGKTLLVETLASLFYGSPTAATKIDCAEFQHSHEVAKLVGSPPGYTGFRESTPMLSQEALDKHQNDKYQIPLVLFDEIEKAHPALWKLLLGVLDKGELSLGDNRHVDFTKAIIFMTSNLGSREIAKQAEGLGFSPTTSADAEQGVYRISKAAAHSYFSPEFMNRVDKILVFRTLQEESLRRIVELEITALQAQLTCVEGPFLLIVGDDVKELILREGTDNKSGARNVKRCIDRFLRFPLSRLVSSGQVRAADVVLACVGSEGKVQFELEDARLAAEG